MGHPSDEDKESLPLHHSNPSHLKSGILKGWRWVMLRFFLAASTSWLVCFPLFLPYDILPSIMLTQWPIVILYLLTHLPCCLLIFLFISCAAYSFAYSLPMSLTHLLIHSLCRLLSCLLLVFHYDSPLGLYKQVIVQPVTLASH